MSTDEAHGDSQEKPSKGSSSPDSDSSRDKHVDRVTSLLGPEAVEPIEMGLPPHLDSSRPTHQARILPQTTNRRKGRGRSQLCLSLSTMPWEEYCWGGDCGEEQESVGSST